MAKKRATKKVTKAKKTTTKPNSKEALEMAEETGNALRIKNVDYARSIFRRFWTDSDKRRSTNSKLRNQLEGGLPYDPVTLKNRGEGWRTNVNFGDSSASRDRALEPYWDMANNVPHKISVTVEENAPDKEKWQKTFEQCFDLMLEDWSMGYIINYRQLVNEYVEYGPAFALWEDKHSPRWEALSNNSVFLPKRASLNSEKWPILAIRKPMGVAELYEKIKDKKSEERASYTGWNVDEVRKAIASAFKESGKTVQGDDWIRIQDEIRNNDLGVNEVNNEIDVIHMYYTEENGKISRYSFTEKGANEDDRYSSKKSEAESEEGYLYIGKEEHDSFSQLIGTLYWEVGNGQVHGVKGFAIRNFHFSKLINRMKSLVVDSSNMSMSMNFERVDEGGEETPPVESYGAINVFPRGLRQLQVYPAGNQGLDIIGVLQQNQAENNAQYRDQGKQIAETDTAKQAEILAGIAAQASQSNASLYLSQLGSSIYAEMMRRLTMKGNKDPDAVKFKDRCVKRGIPKEIFHELTLVVKTSATAGSASSTARSLTWEKMMSLSGSQGFNGKWIKENYIANTLGSTAVDKALLPEDQSGTPSAMRMAMIENGSLGSGIPLPVDQMDEHDVHIQVHLQPATQIVESARQGGEVSQEQMVLMQLLLPHLEEHFNFLNSDETKQDIRRQLFAQFNAVSNAFNGILKQAQNDTEQIQ